MTNLTLNKIEFGKLVHGVLMILNVSMHVSLYVFFFECPLMSQLCSRL